MTNFPSTTGHAAQGEPASSSSHSSGHETVGGAPFFDEVSAVPSDVSLSVATEFTPKAASRSACREDVELMRHYGDRDPGDL